ncbi:MAG TPA: hypothetical protein VF503_19565 [Sphingobium sp.]|uniref:hypothetical protein n=1 Tax=Sphingobium sp. TaxID=1912891 RepID=UPI002ED2499F
MSNQIEDDDALLEEAALRHGLDVDVLRNLLALEDDFPDFTVHGSKTEFARRVAAILDAAAHEGQR